MDDKPDEFIPTRQSLLDRLKNWEDHESWHEFFQIYKRLIYSTALKAGLSEVEAEEVVQETLISVAKTIKDFKYDRARCTFKSWLGHLTRKRIADQFRKRARHEGRLQAEPPPSDTPQTPAIERIPDPNSPNVEEIWEEQWQAKLMNAALDRVKKEVSAEQFQIFDLYAVRKMPAAEVAAALGTSAGQVYLAKHRVAGLLKKEVKRLEARMNKGLDRG
jgi:RNA polymerase sigma factor (sigma-70 family)